jgi:aspartate carbamoyltransferase catalytic subunit
VAEILLDGERLDYSGVITPIEGEPAGKHFLSMHQLTDADIAMYLNEAYAAESIFVEGADILRRKQLFALMRQSSTRTGGGFAHAMNKLGGHGLYQGGVDNSSEAKKEIRLDSEVAFATQTDIYATRTEQEMGPAFSAWAMQHEFERGNLSRLIPVINAGDGKNEHPSQTMGDFFTIHKQFGTLRGVKVMPFGDLERYRAFNSLMIGAAVVGMEIYVVESKAAPVPPELAAQLGDSLHRVASIEEGLEIVDVVYPGRKPEEYNGDDKAEAKRDKRLTKDYKKWVIDNDKINLLHDDAIVLHARPRGLELARETDANPKRRDVQQMEDVIKARMAIVATHMGKSIIAHVQANQV